MPGEADQNPSREPCPSSREHVWPPARIATLPLDSPPIEVMQSKLGNLCANVIETYYELGVLAAEMREDIQSREGRSDGEIEAEIAAELKITPRHLKDCLRLSHVSDAEVNRIIEAGVRWPDLVLLLNMDGIRRLDYWLDRIRNENLTATALEAELGGGSRTPKTRPKRRSTVPKTVNAGLKQLERITGSFFDKLKKSLFARNSIYPARFLIHRSKS